jgi:hypothetical protein
VHERHRSPYPSPSRPLSRWSKWPKEKKLRTTERSNWPRNGTKLGWSDPTFAHDSLAKASRASLQPNKKLLLSARVRGENLGEAGEEGRNYLLHLRLHHLLHVVMRISLGKRESKRHENEKSDAEKAPDRAGATPLWAASSRPNVCGVAPGLSPRNGDRVLPACMQRCNQPDCGVRIIPSTGRR